jgi:hypothetical protein
VTYRASSAAHGQRKITKTVSVTSSDSENPSVTLKIKAQVNAEGQVLSFLPLEADFGDVVPGEKKKIKIELTNDDSTKSKIEIVDWPSSEYIKKTKINKKTLKPGQMAKIELELAKEPPIGAFNASFSIEASDKDGSRITIPIRGSIIAEKPTEDEPAHAKAGSGS